MTDNQLPFHPGMNDQAPALGELPGAGAVPLPSERPTLSVEETATILQVSRSTLYDALQAGELPCIRVRRRILIPTARLRDLLGLGEDEPLAAPQQPTRPAEGQPE